MITLAHLADAHLAALKNIPSGVRSTQFRRDRAKELLF